LLTGHKRHKFQERRGKEAVGTIDKKVAKRYIDKVTHFGRGLR